MRRESIARVTLVAALVLLLLGASSGMAGQSEVSASLGNYSVPVRCFKSGNLAPGGQAFYSCVAADGTAFPEGQRVPTGYYLLVTDVLITPDAGTALTGITDITVYDGYGTNNRNTHFRLRNTQATTFGYNFGAPYLVLSAGHRLDVTSAAFSAYGADVRISGLLVTNLDYLPLALGD